MLPDIDIGGSRMDWILTDVSPTLFVQSFSAELSKGSSAAYIIGSFIGIRYERASISDISSSVIKWL